MPYKKQKAIRSNKKSVIYDLMTDLGKPNSVVRTQFRHQDMPMFILSGIY